MGALCGNYGKSTESQVASDEVDDHFVGSRER